MNCPISERGRKRREALGLTQRQLADRMGASQSMVCTYERRGPQKFETLRRWATALDMTFDDLVFDPVDEDAERERAAENDHDTLRSAGVL